MGGVKILDCTLRDGSYIVGGEFGETAITGIIRRLSDAKAEIVECGWLKNDSYQAGSAFFHTPRDIEKYMTEKNTGTTYVAMIDYNRYDLKFLSDYDGKSIDAIRVVFPKDHVDEGIAWVEPIKSKGYKVYLQAANTLGYSDRDILELSEKVNKAKPTALSIVDTFGAMFHHDLARIAALLNNNLDNKIQLGFHSHNNQQLSYSLSIQFVEMARTWKRGIVVDASLLGMGRGAGNTCTELLVSYLNKFHGKDYDLDLILDTIDSYMSYFAENFHWGYSVAYCIAGMYQTHVNNIAYLLNAHNSSARDIYNVVCSLPQEKRVAYDYDNLEKTYIKYQSNECDDAKVLNQLRRIIQDRAVLLVAPGKTAILEEKKIMDSYHKEDAIVVCVNWISKCLPCDIAFFSNRKRYAYAKEQQKEKFQTIKKIITSNLEIENDDSHYVVNYNRLMKYGWKYYENSMFLCLRLMKGLQPKKIILAGFDGFDENDNYSDLGLTKHLSIEEKMAFNEELQRMFDDFAGSLDSHMTIEFATSSRFCRAEQE